MANGDDTQYLQTATNPKTGQRYGYDAKANKWVSIAPKPQSGGVLSRGASGAWDSTKEMAGNILPHSVGQWAQGSVDMVTGAAPIKAALGAYQNYEQARGKGEGPIQSAATAAGSTLGLPVKTIEGRSEKGDVAGTVGASIPPVLLALLGGSKKGRAGIGEIGEVAERTPKSIAREFMGVAEKDVKPIIKDSAAKAAKAQTEYKASVAKSLVEHEKELADIEAKNEAAQAKHAAKVEEVRTKAAEKISSQQEKAVTSSKAETAAQTKKSVQTRQGPVYQRIVETADKAQANVQQVDTKVRALEGAKWNALRREIGPANVAWEPVQEAVSEAEENILKGSPENISIFKNILKEGEGILSQASVFRGGDISGATNLKEVMRTMDPVRRERFMRDLENRGVDIPEEHRGSPRPGTEVPLDTARGYSTELGQKLYGREIPGDVRRALHSVQDAIEGETVKTIAKAGGKEAVMKYRQLRSNWRDYMEAFYDKDSPLRKLKEGQDPGDKLRPITGDEGDRAIKLFGKYKDLGADVGTMGRLRSLNTQIKELPSSAPKAGTAEAVSLKTPAAPVPKQAPEFKAPAAPTDRPMNAEEARRSKLEAAAKTYSHPPSRWELMFPPLHAYRLALKNLLQSEGFREWLSKD